ncbi:hypothetical protein [uncultured Massilia sp.]|uniref:hypothetical protein n=1 Tax=uncultured Massilia sp. TaxID=169973 RepID=UPI002589A003|nr:hypothetical protein [uncultured Massilia sp.]
MSKAAFTARVFAVYLFILGPVLVVAPNVLLSLFGIPATAEVWIRVVGVIVFMLGVYCWVAAKHELRPFLEASVYTRFGVFIALTAFAVLELGSPMLALFGVIDLLGGVWTYLALKADAQSGHPALTIPGMSES